MVTTKWLKNRVTDPHVSQQVLRPIGMDADDILLSALYVQIKKVLTRMYEAEGDAETERIRVPAGKHLTGADLLGIGDRPVSEAVDFKPWQIRTMRLDNGSR
jgi:hypothetical protein